MNTQRYRLIYNRARNLLMAVAENISSQGKTKGETSSSRSTSHFPNKSQRHIVRFTLAAGAVWLCCNPTAFARIESDPNAPGHQQATVGITANGIPQVDIQTANEKGVSYNVFRQLDVPQQGAIFNNAPEGAQTQIGGWVAPNPHLIRSAETIIGEVRSPDPSVLLGLIEVAGKSAHVIIANPSGITCNGCGFINAHRSTLTTGVPQLDGSGNLESYRVTTGNIQIFGKGLNDEKTYYTDILARAVQINAKVHTQKMTVIAGANTIPVKTPVQRDGKNGENHLGEPHPLAADPANRPAFAIDVAELGCIYANKTWLIGTEAGLGIHTSKRSEFNVGEFRLTTAGELVHRGAITAQENATINTAQGITNEAGARISAKNNLVLSTQGNIDNTGTLAAQNNVDLKATGVRSTITSYTGSMIGAGVDGDGNSLGNNAQLNISATEKASLNGTHVASGDVTAKSTAIDLRGSETTARNLKLTGLNGEKTNTIDTTGAKLTVSQAFTAEALKQLTTNGATISAEDFFLSAYEWSNIDGKLTQPSTNDWLLNFIGNFNNTGGTIKTNARHFGITAANIYQDRSTLDHQGTGNVNFKANKLQSQSSKITTANTITINADQTIFDQATVEAGNIDLASRLFSNRSGSLKLIGTGLQTLNISGLFDNAQGTILSNGNLQFILGKNIDGLSLLNSGGSISALDQASLFIKADGRINNSADGEITGGVINASGLLTLDAASLFNRHGTLQSLVNNLKLTTLGGLDNTGGTIKAKNASTLTSGEIKNDNGQITSGGAMTIKSHALYNRNGWIQSDSFLNIDTQGHLLSNTHSAEKRGLISLGALTLKTGLFDNQYGRLYAAGLFDATTAYFDNRYGVINTDTNAVFNSLGFNNQHGIVSTLANATFNLQQTTLDNDDGVIEATGKLAFTGGQINNRRGKLFGKQGLDFKSLAFDNQSGLVKSDQATTIDTQGQSFINADSGIEGGLHSSGSLTLKTGEFNNRYGRVSTKGEFIAFLGLFNNSYGKLTADGTLQFNGSQINNDHGLIYSVGNANLHLGLGELNNATGTVHAKGTLDILSGLFNNNAGSVTSAKAMTIHTQGHQLINTDSGKDGGIIGEDTVTLTTGAFDNRKGYLGSHKKLSITSSHFFNQSGTVRSLSDAQFQAQNIYNAGGWLRAEHALSLLLGKGLLDNAATTDLAAGLISSRTLAIEAGTLSNIGSNQADQGLRARTIDLNIHDIDNTRGLIHADYSLTLHGREHINNTHGKISAGDTLNISDSQPVFSSRTRRQASGDETVQTVRRGAAQRSRQSYANGNRLGKTQRVTNTGGTLYAGRHFTLDSASLSNDGHLRSLGDMNIALHGDYTHTGNMSANGAMSFTTDGTFTNRALFNALTNLTLNAANLDNQLLGELSAGSSLSLNIANLLTNRGLIDAPNAVLKATTVDNLGTGRIYGDNLSIGASTINNQAETIDGVRRSGTIAARNRLDLGAQTINNKGNSLILSLGDMAIGGSLDTNNQAIGYADTVNNGSSTIDAAGNLIFAAHTLNNTNDNFSMEIGQTESYSLTYIQPQGSTTKYRSDELVWEGWSNAGQYRVKATGAVFRSWTQFNVVRREFESQVVNSDPAKIRAGGTMNLTGTHLINDKSQIISGGAMTGDLVNLRNIDAEGQHIIKEGGTARSTWTKYRGKIKRRHDRKWSGYQAYTPADIITSKKLSIAEVEPNTAHNTTDYTLDKRSDHQRAAVIEVPVLSAAPQVQAINAIALEEQPQFDVTRQTRSTDSNAEAAGSSSVASENTAPAPMSASTSAQAPTQLPLSATPREVIRTIEPNIKLPTASLYTVNPSGPDTQPLIETDPRFTNYQQWLGSQALMTAGTVNPNITQKRLSDNFHEQQLIRDQVTQLTGRRFLNGYQNDHDQYQALINNGVSVAQTFQLTPGIALTPEQIARLTTDIVWLVEKNITLADGSQAKALVPQIYVKVKEGDLKGDGALISGDSVQFRLAGDLENGATIAGRTLVDISSQNINNHLGRIQAADARLSALLDINNTGGSFEAENSLNMNAGQDINIQSTTQSAAQTSGPSSFKRTNLDRVAGIYVGRGGNTSSNTAASLIAQAGRDINLTSAVVDNADDRATSQISFTSGRDTNLGTQKVEVEEKLLADANHQHQQSSSQEVGTSITTQGDTRFQAGRDVNARAANVNSEQGQIQLNAGNNVNLTEGQKTQTLDEYHKTSSKGFLSSSSKTTRDMIESSTGIATTMSGQSVSATAGNDVNLTGSNVVSDQGTDLTAGNNVSVLAGQNTHRENHFVEEKKSGLMGSGGVGFTIGSQQQSKDAKLTETSSNASTVGSTNGNVNITAGKAYTQVGSDLIALSSDNTAGNINVEAQSIDVLAAENTASQRVEEKFKQSGLTVAVTSPVITAIQTAEQMRQAKEKTQSSRMKLLADAATVAAAYNAGAAVAANKDQAGGVNISVSVGSSQSESVSTQTATTLTSSNVKAAKDINFNATGAGTDSNINVVASKLKAGEDASFKADNDVNFLAGQNTSEQRSKNKSSSASIGVSFGTDGFLVNLSASGAKGKANGTDIEHTHTEVEAGQKLTVESGRDTNLKGATATGKQITVDIRRDLNIESVQNSSTYDSKQQSIGGSLSVGYGKMSGSFSASQSKVNSDYLSVTQQSGFKAGNDGFDINVQGNTDLKAGLIASTDQAAAANKNTLTTGSLTTSDLQNKAEYEASSISVGAGTTSLSSVPNPAGMGFGNDSDSQSSTTKAGISQANITITDEAKQKELTGKDAEQKLADLNRDVSSDKETSGALTNKFDATRVQNEIDAQTEITKTFGQQAAQAIGTFAQSKVKEYSDKATDLRKQAANPDNNLSPDERQALFVQADQQSDEASKWSEGGRYRVVMHTVAGGLVGNVAGAAAAATVASAAPKLNDLQRDLTQSLKDAGASEGVANLASNLIAQATAAGVGAAVGAATGNMTAGTAVGLNIDSNNRQLHSDEKQRIRDEIAKRYAKDQGVSETQAVQTLEAQLLRQVDSKAAKAGGWDQQASNYLNSYKAAHAGEIVGKDQWGNPVPLFGVGSQSQRNDSTIFSANPQTHTPPSALGLGQVSDYAKGIGKGIANKAQELVDAVIHPIDTVVNTAKGLYNAVTDPKGTAEQVAEQLQSKTRNSFEQAGEGNFKAAGEQMGEQVGNVVVPTGAAGVVKGASNAVGKVAQGVATKIDDVAQAKVEAKALATRMQESAIHRDDSLFTAVAEQIVEAQKAGWKTPDGKPLWPPENGKVPGTEEIVQTKVGQRLDRFGGTNERSSFLAPSETPIEQRALSNITDLSLRDEYIVLKPFSVEQSRVMPWFGKEGMGIQLETMKGVELTIPQLIEQGYLKKVGP